MRIKMLKTARGSVDGVNIAEYAEGLEYDLPPVLIEAFLLAEYAEPVKETAAKKTEDLETPETPEKPKKGKGK